MRRTATRVGLVAAALSLTLTLAACGDGGDGSTPKTTPSASATAAAQADPAAKPTAADVKALASVEVSGEQGAKPTITVPEGFTLDGYVARLVEDGDGDELGADDLFTAHITGFGADGAATGSTYDTDQANTMNAKTGLVSFDELVPGAHAGARILLGATSNGQVQILVIDVVGKVSPRAIGTPVAPKPGLPTVKLADDGTPTITPATGAAPTELVVQPLIEGTGPAVTAGQNVLVQYAGVLWDGTPFDDSWSKGQPFPVQNVGQAQVIDGWNEGLVGQKVGSQVLLVVPPAKGYGDQANGSIPANSTLVFVVDILAAS